MNIDGKELSRPQCPHCHSFRVTRISTKTLVFAGIGAGLGGILMSILVLSRMESTDRDRVDGLPPVVFGMFTGAMAGFSFGNSGKDESVGAGYMCLDCFHHFTRFGYSEE